MEPLFEPQPSMSAFQSRLQRGAIAVVLEERERSVRKRELSPSLLARGLLELNRKRSIIL